MACFARSRRLAEALHGAAAPAVELANTVDRLAADLLRISAVLAETYGTPDLGNKTDPVDELVYIILAQAHARGGLPGRLSRAEGAIRHLGRTRRRSARGRSRMSFASPAWPTKGAEPEARARR